MDGNDTRGGSHFSFYHVMTNSLRAFTRRAMATGVADTDDLQTRMTVCTYTKRTRWMGCSHTHPFCVPASRLVN